MKPYLALAAALAACLLVDCSPKAQGAMAAQLALVRATQTPTDVSFAGGTHDTDWTPFQFFDETRIFLPAKVNGQTVDVMLDSGAGVTSIDSAYAAKAGIKPIGQARIHGTGGDIDAGVATGVTIEIGGVRLKNLTVLVLDLSSVAARIGHPTPVIVGREAFSNLVVDLDLPKQRLAFRDASEWKAPPNAVRVPLVRTASAQRQLPIAVEGQAPTQANFDLGNGAALALPQDFAQTAGVLDGRPESKRLFGGVGGLAPQTITTVKTLSFAGIQLHDVPTCVIAQGRPLNLGMGVLRRFHIMTDYAHDALYAVADPDTVARPFRKERSGLNLDAAGDRLNVVYVSPGSPAEAAGWRVGEAVVAIDGHHIDPGYPGSELSRWASKAAGDIVTLTLLDGSTRKLTLKDYY